MIVEPDVVVRDEDSPAPATSSTSVGRMLNSVYADQRRDAARAALDVARHAAGLAFRWKRSDSACRWREHLQRDVAHGALRDLREHEFAQLGERRRRQPQQRRTRPAAASGSTSTALRRRRLDRQRVDDALQHERHADVGELGADQEDEREQHAPLERPQVRRERPQDVERRAGAGRRRRVGGGAGSITHRGRHCPPTDARPARVGHVRSPRRTRRVTVPSSRRHASRLTDDAMTDQPDRLTLPSTTPTLRVVPMPSDANLHGDVFGGWIMAQVDIAGSLPAVKRANGRVATVAVNSFVFKNPCLRRRPAVVLRGGREGRHDVDHRAASRSSPNATGSTPRSSR